MSLFSATSRSTVSVAARKTVLQLYKDCLKSALSIPDPSQRVMYITYIREGFRSHKARCLVSESIEAKRAIRDAEEQLERMNYYHSIREMKEQGEEYPPSITTTTTSTITDGDGDGDDATTTADESTTRSSLADSKTSQLQQHDQQSRLAVAEMWILTALPELHPDDLSNYSQQLLEDGFDSLSLLDFVVPEDLDFMKKGHQRAIIQAHQIV